MQNACGISRCFIHTEIQKTLQFDTQTTNQTIITFCSCKHAPTHTHTLIQDAKPILHPIKAIFICIECIECIDAVVHLRGIRSNAEKLQKAIMSPKIVPMAFKTATPLSNFRKMVAHTGDIRSGERKEMIILNL